ncbi:unnamed protein product, partial [Iphiclides podalirius]
MNASCRACDACAHHGCPPHPAPPRRPPPSLYGNTPPPPLPPAPHGARLDQLTKPLGPRSQRPMRHASREIEFNTNAPHSLPKFDKGQNRLCTDSSGVRAGFFVAGRTKETSSPVASRRRAVACAYFIPLHATIRCAAVTRCDRRNSDFLCLRGAGRAAAACRSRSRAAGARAVAQSGAECGRALPLRAGVGLTGLEAPLLELDEARRLEQRVEEAHVGGRHGRALYERARCHAATGHARRAPLTWPLHRPPNGGAARASRDHHHAPTARRLRAIDAVAARSNTRRSARAAPARSRTRLARELTLRR